MKRRRPVSQKVTLASDGIVVPKRMQPGHAAATTPAVRLSRLKKLIETHEPRICVVRGEGIGDVITTTPVVHALKQYFPKVHLTYATNTQYLDGALVEVLKHNPDVDQIIERELLKESDFDLVVNLHCPCIGYEKRGNPPISRIDLFAQHAGLKLEDPVPRFFLQEEEVEAGKTLMGPLMTERTILVQPTASTQRRSLNHRIMKEALASLYKEEGIRSVVLTHSSDWATDVLWDNLPGAAVFKNLKIRQIAGVMVHCDLVLCPDSSILHLAAALRVPTVAVFGPTHPDARVNHYELAVPIWEVRGMAPCPCWYEHCPIRETCWSKITSDIVAENCMNHIGSTDKRRRKITIGSSVIETEII